MDDIFSKYKLLDINSSSIIDKINKRLISGDDELISNHSNFFTKSFVISICTYLESCLKELAFQAIQNKKAFIINAGLPKNLILWEIKKKAEIKQAEWEFANFDITITLEDIDDYISGNPGKTIDLFRRVGFDITACTEFRANKDFVAALVTKRNSIIHHNDDALDVTLQDLKLYITKTIEYIDGIKNHIS